MSSLIVQSNPLQDIWPAPDLSVLNEGRRRPPALPLEAFPRWSDWIASCAKQSSAPVDFVALGTLMALSALMANARWVLPWEGWAEPAVLWGACIGNPSSGKTPALRPVLGILDKLEGELAVSFEDERRHYEADKAAAKVLRDKWESEVEEAVSKGYATPLPPAGVDVEEPECPRIKVNDTTIEKLAARLAARPKGLLLFRDELSGWIGNLDKFGAGDRGFWIEAFNGGSYAIDRVKHGNKPVRVPRLSVAILGGIQPDRLQSALMRGDDDGLASRFLMVWPEVGLPVRPTGSVDLAWAENAIRRLNDLQMALDENGNPTPSFIPMTDKAADLLDEWRVAAALKERSASGLLVSHIGKVPGITARLSLILQYMRWAVEGGPEPERIDETSVGCAAHLMGEYFIPMAERAYGDAALPEVQRHAATLAKAIRERRVREFNARTLRREWGLPGLRDARAVSEAIRELEDANIVRHNPTRAGSLSGRQTEDYLVNPTFLEV